MFVFSIEDVIFRYNVATMLPESSKSYRPMILKYITEGKLLSNLQVTEAVSYLKKLPQGCNVIHIILSYSSWMFLTSKKRVE